MTSTTNTPLNIVKDAVPPATSQYNEGSCTAFLIQRSNQNLDSSESLPSDHGSIYEAAVASIDESLSREDDKIDDNAIDGAVECGSSRILREEPETADGRLSKDHGPQHSRQNTLETITEQRSTPRLGPLILLPRVNPGDPTSIAKPQPALCRSRRRDAFSLNDLDSGISDRKQIPLRGKHHCPNSPSSSSSDIVEQSIPLRAYRSPVEPAQPILPPPVRVPTPPGLPSFGSPEAMRFRNRSQPSHARRSSSQSSHLPPPHPSQGTVDTGPGRGTSGSRGGSLRRFFLSWAEPQPAPMAPGVIGRAEDGTLVRARFGTRQSGHGIGVGPGSRGLESHPFHRSTLPVARVNRVAQMDGSPHNSRDEGQLSQPEAFAPPRRIRASSSSSHSSLPYPNASGLPQLRPPSRLGQRSPLHAGVPAGGSSHPTYRNSEARLPRIVEMTNLSRADNPALTQDVHDPGNPYSPSSSQPSPGKIKSYWTRFREMSSVLCCQTVSEEEAVDGLRSRQVDGGGDVPGDSARSRNASPVMANSGRRALDIGGSPWIPAWGCQPGRFGAGDGAFDDW